MDTFRVQVADYELCDLFHALQIPTRLAAGCLTETLRYRDVGPAKHFRGVSYHIQLLDKQGTAIARIHCITTEAGRTLYWPTSIRVGDVNIYREGHQRPPWGRLRLRLRWEIGHQRRRNEMIRRAILPRLNRR